MGKHDMLRDPHFTSLIFRLESRIAGEDRAAREAGSVAPKDSAVKSALRKAELALDGKLPKKPPSGALEEWTAALARVLANACRDMTAAGEASLKESAACLGAVRGSLDIRREMAGGDPRGYLDFLAGFIAEAGDTSEAPPQAGMSDPLP